jgi:hypothetical protein
MFITDFVDMDEARAWREKSEAVAKVTEKWACHNDIRREWIDNNKMIYLQYKMIYLQHKMIYLQHIL